MATPDATAPPRTPRLAYRPAEVIELTGMPKSSFYALVAAGEIPTIGGFGSAYLVPAWALDAWIATGDWRHPDWRPVPPSADTDDDQADAPAEVIPLHPDAS